MPDAPHHLPDGSPSFLGGDLAAPFSKRTSNSFEGVGSVAAASGGARQSLTEQRAALDVVMNLGSAMRRTRASSFWAMVSGRGGGVRTSTRGVGGAAERDGRNGRGSVVIPRAFKVDVRCLVAPSADVVAVSGQALTGPALVSCGGVGGADDTHCFGAVRASSSTATADGGAAVSRASSSGSVSLDRRLSNASAASIAAASTQLNKAARGDAPQEHRALPLATET
ncbi:hypothetical protein T484DRAFT_1779310 [Baffinella frigidus]|nr:hypothetical protein T484DRAFT_1779310 [Cryptophyta sp. CCMP2293]